MSDIIIVRRFISLLSDFGFKIAFGNTANTLFLRQSIQALIKSDIPIISVQLSRNEIAGLTETSGGGLFDVSCIDELGHHYIIEMQLTDVKTFIKRSTFYGSHRYTSIIRKGEWRFKDLKKVYVISILNGIVYPKSEEYHHIGSLRNQHGELMGDEITQVIFELKKWNKEVENIKFDLDKLIYVMKTTAELKVGETFTPPPFWSEEWIQNAIKQLDMAKMTPEEREYAERQIVKAVAMAEERKDMEESRIKAEESRIKAEESRIKAEESRIKAEEVTLKLEQTESKIVQIESKLEQVESKVEQSEAQIQNAVVNLLKRDMALDDISDILGVSLEKVEEIKESLNG